MKETRVKVSSIVESQLPSFVREEFPLVQEFLSQYYKSIEYQGGVSDLLQNIDQYVKIDHLTNLTDSTTLTSDVELFDSTINVQSTAGFPDSYGFLYIDSEIITYTSKTATSFLGCIRGFSGVTSYQKLGSFDELQFSDTDAAEHTSGSTVTNLSILFLKQFFYKIKKQISPGFEDREFFSDLNESLFIKQSKDFYSSKGTDASFKILFGALYGKNVEVIRPRDYLIQPSDAQYRITQDLVVEAVSGNPLDLENCTLYQDETSFFKKSSGTITKVEKIVRDSKDYYVISLDFDYDKDITYRGTIFGQFDIHPQTKTTSTIAIDATTIEVDSTVGFPESGTLLASFENGTTISINYTSKTLNQFLDCSGISQSLSRAQDVKLDAYAYGYSGSGTDNEIRVRITGVLKELDILDKTFYLNKNDIIKVKTLGKDLPSYKENNWFYNVPTRYEVQNIELLDISDYSYKVNLFDQHNFVVGDSITMISSTGEEKTGNVVRFDNKFSFTIKNQGELNTNLFYNARKNILKGNFQNYPSLNQYTTNVQNIYSDFSESLYVASPSLPTYLNQNIEINERFVSFTGSFNGTELSIAKHGLYTGDAVAYIEQSATNRLNVINGFYFVKRVDENTIKLCRSRANIDTNNFISISGAVTNNKLYLANFVNTDLIVKTINSQKLIRKLTEPLNDINVHETSPGNIGIFVNGVELKNYKSSDRIFYGPILNIESLAGGSGYDVVNPPILTLSDSIGSGCTSHVSVNGSLQRIDIVDPGFDYVEQPLIIISGGNGANASAKANLVSFDHSLSFNSNSSAGLVNLSNNTIGFSSFHKFRDAEEVIYNPEGQTSVGGLSTNSTYYVSVQNSSEIKLHRSFDESVAGINTITLSSYGVGNHIFRSTQKKKKIGSITIENSGSNYQNKKVTTTPVGVNTASNTIFASDHGYSSGELVVYSSSENLIGGLSTSKSYYVTKVNNDEFKLSDVGVGTVGISSEVQDFFYRTKQYINLTSTGSGVHSFNYEPITVQVVGRIGVSSFSGQNFGSVVQPIFRGEIQSVFVEASGTSYGSEEIINYEKQPEFILDSGSEAQVIPVINDGKIVEVLVNSPGSGYNSPPNLIVEGEGSGVLLTPIVSDGQLLEVKVISTGAGYLQKNTTITVEKSGINARFKANINRWNINEVEKLIETQQILNDDGIIASALNSDYGLQYTHAYAPRKLRESVRATKLLSGSTIFVQDLQLVNGKETSQNAHSPIIGWAYDGNPIYGPYGYSSITGGSIRSMESGYQLKSKPNRPNTTIYPLGLFVEDYEYVGTGDLDVHNGRFCVTPEYPNGIYAYFCTVNSGPVESSGIFKNYKRPVFPYVIGPTYKSSPIAFNFLKSSNQDEININSENWIRNTTPYNLLNSRSYYDYLTIPNSIKNQNSIIKSTTLGTIDSVGIITGGSGYKVGDSVVFDTENTSGKGLKAKVSSVVGKSVSSVSVESFTVNNIEFVPFDRSGNFIGFATSPHGFLNNDLVTLTSLYDYNKSTNISVNTNSLTLTTGIGSTGYTGLVTYFNVSGFLNYPNIRENDIYDFVGEQVKVLNIDPLSSRIRVLRNQNGTLGITSYSAGIALTERTRKLQANFGITTSYQYNFNKEFYFNPSETIGIGTTTGIGVGVTLTFANPGAGITQVVIPTKSLYIPNHQLETGTQLVYSSNGGTPIGISTNGINLTSLADNSVVYVAKLSNDLIGISTTKVGVGSTGGFVGLGATSGSTLYLTSIGSGVYHSFKTAYPNILSGQISKNVVTVSVDSSHQLSSGDQVTLNVTSGISTTIIIKYDDYNRRLIANPRSFVSGDVNIGDGTITIANHGFVNGQKVIYTSTSVVGGLENEGIYYATVVDGNKIKLSNSYYDATRVNPNNITFTSANSGTLSLINPQIKVYKNTSVVFDLSDSSLSFTKNTTLFPAFSFDLYKDSSFSDKFDSTKNAPQFEVSKSGTIGVDANARLTLTLNDNVPTILYYNLTPIDLDNNVDSKKEIITDSEFESNSIQFLQSEYSKKHTIIANNQSEFKFNLLKKPEVPSYTSTSSILNYHTNSLSASGAIQEIEVTSKGRDFDSLPAVTTVSSANGSGAILISNSSSIGTINTTEIEDIGFNYSADFSVRPIAKLPDIIKLDPLSSLKSVGVSSRGRGYNISPDLILIDGLTNKVVSDVDLDYNVFNSTVTILKNTKGISSVTPTIIPVNNVNGVGISTIRFIESSKDVVVGLAASFSTGIDFPFAVGDRVIVEGISVGVGSTGKGYNSSQYNYALFTINGITPNIGGIGATVSYNISSYLSSSETPGKFDPVNSSGRIVPENQFPIFNVELQKNTFYKGEEVISPSARGTILDWDQESGYLKVSSIKDFKVGETLVAQTSTSQGVVESIISFDSAYEVSSSSIVKKGWSKETGFLNNNFQRTPDNDYYQYFSYSLKSEIPLDTWDNPVSNLNHTSGFKKFSDLIILSDAGKIGLTTDQNNGDFTGVADLSASVNTNCVFDYDLVTENNITIDGNLNSNEIIFGSKILQDYIESVGNRVLIIDDISSEFSNDPRPTDFSVVDTFAVGSLNSNLTRFKKYLTFVEDTFFTNERQLLFVSLLHDGTTGYLNQYGRLETVTDLGSFDFTISGTEGNLLFYPIKSQTNSYNVESFSYDVLDSIAGVGTTSLGTVVKIDSSAVSIPQGTTSATTIVGIATTFRSSKVLVQIGATDGSYYEVDELTMLHDGSNVQILDYGQLNSTIIPISGGGIGTYNAYISGSLVNIDFIPNSGLSTTFNINSIRVSLANTSASGVSTVPFTNSKISSKVVSIASSSSPTANIISQFDSEYDGAYYFISIEDTTNNQYESLELLTLFNNSSSHIVEYGNVRTASPLGTFDTTISGDYRNLTFTPNEDINVQLRIYENAIGRSLGNYDTFLLGLNSSNLRTKNALYLAANVDVKRDFNLTHRQLPIFERYFVGDSTSIVNTTNNTISLPNHFFVTGEEVSYTFPSLGGRIGIATTTVSGIGLTDKLPSSLYIVKVDDLNVQVAASASLALRATPVVFDLQSVGIGTSHRFVATNQNAKAMIAIDNVIQSPIVSTAITTTLSQEVQLIDVDLKFVGITSFFGGDLIKVGNEIMRINSVGYGETNIIRVERPWMGSGISTHASGDLVTKVFGNYNIVDNVINFIAAPYGETPVETTDPDETDFVGITTRSTFSGRTFIRNAVKNTENDPYSTNYIFDSISSGFDGSNSDFILKTNNSNATGFSTSNAIILLNQIFQGPSRNSAIDIIGDYGLSEGSGISTISFTGAATSISYDINTSSLPRGGIIISVGSTSGFGFQPLVSAGGTATVSIAGTISTISIGNSGSGYRSGVQSVVRVGVATSSVTETNVEYIGTATISNGNITGVAITNPGIGYTTSNPPLVIFDSPLSYSDIPLVYSSSSRPGVGTEATLDIIVGQGSSVISFELKNLGYGYGQGEILTVDIGGSIGIPTNTSLSYKEFQITIERTHIDSFSGWTVGDLQVLDPFDSLFDGSRRSFPIKIDGQQTTIRSKPGSNIDVQACLLIFINDIPQVPGKAYTFTGGSILTFSEPPKQGDKSKVIFYRGTGDIDTQNVDILETVKIGDELTIYDDSIELTQNERLVTDIISTEVVQTNTYPGPGISANPDYKRPVVWCRQTEDKIIDGQEVGKDREIYKAQVYPAAYLIRNVGIDSSVIFIDSVKTFFDKKTEFENTETKFKKVSIINQNQLIQATATAVVSAAGTISSVTISNGGVGYSTAPEVTISNPVGLGSTQRASAISTITNGVVTSISVSSPGTGYTSTNPPIVLIAAPNPVTEVITNVGYEGDFGVITGINTVSVGVASTGIVFDLFIPKNSFLRDLSANTVGIATTGVSGIQTGYYFTVFNSNVGSPLTSIDQNGSIVGVGTSFIDNVYEVAAVSIAQTSVPGIGQTYVAKVTVSVTNYNGLTGIGFSNFYGEYSWGRLTNLTRTKPESFTVYNTNGISGINSSPIVQRIEPLKNRNYNT